MGFEKIEKIPGITTGKKCFPTQARTPDIAMENVLVTMWPCTIKRYPNRGEPHSWSSIFEFCRDELAVHVRLHARDRKVAKYPSLQAELTLRGENVADAMKYVWRETRQAGINLHDVPNKWADAGIIEAEEAADAASSSSGQQVVVPLRDLADGEVESDAEAVKEKVPESDAASGSAASESGESSVTVDSSEDEEEVPLSTPMAPSKYANFVVKEPPRFAVRWIRASPSLCFLLQFWTPPQRCDVGNRQVLLGGG